MLDLASVVSDVRRGMIPAHVYADPEIFAAERDRLFTRSWVFLAHESEIPDPGDYVVRRVLADSFIVARDEAGVVRVMFNMCLQRGMQVCRAELGNASHFRCPYHAWTYRNDGRLAGLPFHQEAYGGEARATSPPKKSIEALVDERDRQQRQSGHGEKDGTLERENSGDESKRDKARAHPLRGAEVQLGRNMIGPKHEPGPRQSATRHVGPDHGPETPAFQVGTLKPLVEPDTSPGPA